MTADEQSLAYHSIRLYVTADRYYDTWMDFHLIPSERPTVTIPSANTKLINIPGKKDPLDFTTYLTGHETYANRTGSWSFYTDNDYVENNLGGWVAFDKRLRSIFNGRVSKIILRDSPAYFYAGELSVGQWNTGQSFSTVTISYNLYPFKKSVLSSMDRWTFDDFDFRDGIIMYLKDMEVNGSRVVKVYGSRERISPHISGTSAMKIEKWNGSEWIYYGRIATTDISGQDIIIPRLVIDEGENMLRFTGNGYVTIDYRRGLL